MKYNMLTDEDKKFIRDNRYELTAGQMATIMDRSRRTINCFLESNRMKALKKPKNQEVKE